MIQVRKRHLTVGPLDEELVATNHGIDRPISEAAAVTIASYYQAPTGRAAILASFASGMPVDREALDDAVDEELYRFSHDTAAITELQALRRWIGAQS